MELLINFFKNYINDYYMLFVSLIGSIIILIISPILIAINYFNNGCKPFKKGKNIIITGASSGLGKSIALNYSRNGGDDVHLGLIGRNKKRLESIKLECLKNGVSIVEVHVCDVNEKIKMNHFLNDFNSRFPIDIVYANAAVNELMVDKDLSFTDRCYEIIDTNVIGLLNTVLPVVEIYEKRKTSSTGQIVLISSVGPMSNFVFPAYNGSKSFVNSFAQTLRNRLSDIGVGVTLVVPGYIETPMSSVLEQKELPFMVTPDYGASEIIKGVEQNKSMIGFSLRIFLLSYFISLIPPNLKDSVNLILSKFMKFPDPNKPQQKISSNKIKTK